ncbi:anaphase promoting complex 6 [Actinidia rufa]|uniref:Anaphase promoting complex 6 n=1 Tax=Actinidia rufa TaxID=165716 RepID=A0A7J0G2T3_9ERIC|nr:anaphase promoting complex 6 [Actinidia rufa]
MLPGKGGAVVAGRGAVVVSGAHGRGIGGLSRRFDISVKTSVESSVKVAFPVYIPNQTAAPQIQNPPQNPLSLSLSLSHLRPTSTNPTKMRVEEIEKLRGVVRDCVSKHLYSSAIFFADKVAALTSDPADIYMQAQALFLGRHYRRAFHLLNASQIVLRDLRFRYLAAKCLESNVND